MEIDIQPINATPPKDAFDIKSGDVIYIFQHPGGTHPVSMSSSQCKVAGE